MSIVILLPTKIKKDFLCENLTIIDGDTFHCNSMKIRILGIDSPELERQKRWYVRFILNLSKGYKVNYSCLKEYAYKAKNFLELTLNDCKKVTIVPYKSDKYHRTLAIVYCNQKDVGAIEITNGLAIVYPFGNYPMKDKYYNLTIEAMLKRKGLWNCVILKPQKESN